MKVFLKRLALFLWSTTLAPILLICSLPVTVPLIMLGYAIEWAMDEWEDTK